MAEKAGLFNMENEIVNLYLCCIGVGFPVHNLPATEKERIDAEIIGAIETAGLFKLDHPGGGVRALGGEIQGWTWEFPKPKEPTPYEKALLADAESKRRATIAVEKLANAVTGAAKDGEEWKG
jgi:hypothetical protein